MSHFWPIILGAVINSFNNTIVLFQMNIKDQIVEAPHQRCYHDYGRDHDHDDHDDHDHYHNHQHRFHLFPVAI